MDYTKEYYKKHSPRYSVARMVVIVDWLKKITKPESSLIDIGCGDGSSLAYISKETGIKNLTGLDSALKYLKNAKNNYKNINFLQGNVCNLNIKQKYDVVIIAAVLHHLVGRTRKESKNLSALAFRKCLELLKSDSQLIIMEPVFSNNLLMSFLFYIKKFFAVLSSNRIALFGYWNNIGAPVVSYYSAESLIDQVESNGGKVLQKKYVPAQDKLIYRVLNTRRGDLYLLIRKD